MAERFRERRRGSGVSHEVVNFYDVITRLVKFTQQLVSLLLRCGKQQASVLWTCRVWGSEHCDWDWDWDCDCDCESRRSRVESCELYLQPEFLLLLRHLWVLRVMLPALQVPTSNWASLFCSARRTMSPWAQPREGSMNQVRPCIWWLLNTWRKRLTAGKGHRVVWGRKDVRTIFISTQILSSIICIRFSRNLYTDILK